MSKHTGRDVKIGIAKEATRGQGGAATYWIPHRSVDLDYKVQTIVDEQGYGVIEDSVDTKVVSKWAEGSISGTVRDKAIGLLLLSALGDETTSSPEAGVFAHTFVVEQGHQHQSLAISYEDGVEDRIYPRAMIKTLEIIGELNEFIVFNADFISDTGSPQAVTAAYAAENDFTADQMKLYYAENQANLATATETKAKAITVTIDKELEKDDALGQSSPNDILNKSMSVEIEITIDHENDTFKDRFNAGSPMALRVEMISDVTIGATSHPKLTIDLHKAVISDWTTNKDLDNVLTETFTAKAHFKLADSKMIQAVLTNQASQFGY